MVLIIILGLVLLIIVIFSIITEREKNRRIEEQKKVNFEFFKTKADKLTLKIYDIMTYIYCWEKELPPIQYTASDYLNPDSKEFKKYIEERKRRFTDYHYSKVDFIFEYKGVDIKT